MSRKRTKNRPGKLTSVERTAHIYRAALNRLIEGRATHPDHAGRPIRITPAAVAREARRSRNPLYTTHRTILDDIVIAAGGPTIATDLADTITRLESEMSLLRAANRLLEREKRMLATENLALLHRARLAEERIASHAFSLSANC
jgi:hypothetical protein